MNTISELIVFLKNPVLEKDSNQSFPHKAKVFLILLISCFSISFFLSIIIGMIYNAGLIENDYHAFDDLKKLEGYKVLLAAAVFAPIIEEIMFRSLLTIFKYPLQLYIKLIPFSNWKITFPVIYIKSFENPKVFKIAFYVFAIAFGLVHLSNYQIDSQILLFAPILIAPQLILGLIFGFIRVRLGFQWAILMHATYNGVLVSLFLLAKDAVQIE